MRLGKLHQLNAKKKASAKRCRLKKGKGPSRMVMALEFLKRAENMDMVLVPRAKLHTCSAPNGWGKWDEWSSHVQKKLLLDVASSLRLVSRCPAWAEIANKRISLLDEKIRKANPGMAFLKRVDLGSPAKSTKSPFKNSAGKRSPMCLRSGHKPSISFMGYGSVDGSPPKKMLFVG